ncbi:MAG: acyl-CoA dehydratase activase [Planctomycetota bacterium]|nr:acyl-CoA dehydratase activase [Planctomycetota bacterium]
MRPPPPAGRRLGLDLGARAAKAALIDAAGNLIATALDASEPAPARAIANLLRGLPAGEGGPPASAVAATGYGRALAECAGKKITEITCHARGVRRLHPDALSILDIGGQDAKAIRLAPNGRVEDFAMNDRCAAGTGRFLEMAARRYGLEIGEVGEFCGLTSAPGPGRAPFEISSTCVVFAESELIGLDARGMPAAESLRAVLRAVARRVALLLKRAGAVEPLYFTGGAARNAALADAIARECGLRVRISRHAQFTGALGAALSLPGSETS